MINLLISYTKKHNYQLSELGLWLYDRGVDIHDDDLTPDDLVWHLREWEIFKGDGLSGEDLDLEPDATFEEYTNAYDEAIKLELEKLGGRK